MGISYEIKERLIIIRTEGNFEAADLKATFQKIFSDPDFKTGANILVHDLDSVFVPSTQEIEEGVRNVESIMKSFAARMAIVVSSDVNFGMGRMFEAISENRNINVRVFKDLDVAKKWLEE